MAIAHGSNELLSICCVATSVGESSWASNWVAVIRLQKDSNWTLTTAFQSEQSGLSYSKQMKIIPWLINL